MAVPWQADTASCRSGYDTRYDPYLPTFWPARVPNQVLTEADYAIAVDESRPLAERQAAFERRANWLRWLTPRQPQYMLDMVEHFGKFGVIEGRPGPSDGHVPGTTVRGDPKSASRRRSTRSAACARSTCPRPATPTSRTRRSAPRSMPARTRTRRSPRAT